MSRRLNITIDGDVTDHDALFCVRAVVLEGRISQTAGKQHYCHITRFSDGMMVYASVTKTGQDTFRVWMQEAPND